MNNLRDKHGVVHINVYERTLYPTWRFPVCLPRLSVLPGTGHFIDTADAPTCVLCAGRA